MNEGIEKATLEDVLNDYVAFTPVPDYTTLAEWISRYPQYERELTDFTVSWMQMKTFPPVDRWDMADAEKLVITARYNGPQGSPASSSEQRKIEKAKPLQSLIGAAPRLNLSQFAEQAELSPALIRKLDRRQIKASRVPNEVLEVIADIIQVPPVVVAEYLKGEARLPTGAHYKSEQAPRLTEPEDFFDAIRNDRSMSEERKARWLSLEPDNER